MRLFKQYIKTAFIAFFITSGSFLHSVEELTDATPEYIEESYQKALKSYLERNYEDSLNHIRHVISSDMNHYKLRYLAAHNHWRLGNYTPASIHFRTAIDAEPAQPGAYIDYALMLFQLQKYNDAAGVLQTGINKLTAAGTKIPAKLYNALARTYLHRGNIAQALANAEKAKAAFEKNRAGIKDKLEAVLLEGRSHLALGNYEKAELSVQWAISMKKDNAYAHNLLGYIYERWAVSLKNQKDLAEKAKQLKDSALEAYQKAAENENLPEDFKQQINQSIKRVSAS